MCIHQLGSDFRVRRALRLRRIFFPSGKWGGATGGGNSGGGVMRLEVVFHYAIYLFQTFSWKTLRIISIIFFLTMWGMSSWPPTWFQNGNGVTIVHSVEMSESQRLSSWRTLFLYFIGVNYFLKNAFYGHCSPHFWSLFRTESLERSYQSREVFSRFWKRIAKATSRKVIWFIFFSHYTFVVSGAINLPVVFANLISKRLYLAIVFNFSDYFFMAE